MKIKLKSPFIKDFKAGYLNINKEPRRLVLLVRFDNTKTTVSYARYLMSCKLNRYLLKSEEVDHKDNDKLNDQIDNLQILTREENNIKKREFYNIKLATDITLTCPNCNTIFTRPSHNIKHKLLKGKTPCCSRKCGGIFGSKS